MLVVFVPGSRFIALLLPHSPGAPFDLATDQYLSALLRSFIREKSESQHTAVSKEKEGSVYFTFLSFVLHLFLKQNKFCRSWQVDNTTTATIHNMFDCSCPFTFE